MTESTQLQTTESNNAGVTKMEPPPPLTSTSPAPSTATAMEQLQQQHLVQQQQQQQQQQYALKWNDFQSSILSSFRHLRDEEDFVDVTLACDQRSFTAHKVVLSACSPYFRKLLKANPCEHPIVILRDIRCEDVENLLSFMYNGEVNVSHEQLPDFLKTAHLLQIRGLADVNGGSPMMAGFNATAAAAVAANNNKQHHNNNSISNNNNKFNFAATATGGNGNNNNNNNNSTLATPFNTPTLMGSTIAAAAAVAAAAATGAASLAAAGNNNNNNNINSNSNSSNNNNNMNQNSSNNNNSSTLSNALSAAINSATNTPAIQELKASSASPANHHWDVTDADSNRNSHLTPPPQKRIKSADLFRAQHGISPERLLLEREFPVAGQHALTRERNRDRDRSRETSRDRERSMELRESLLGQALENSNGQQLGGNQKPHGDLASLHAQSAGEDSNSSDTEPSDRGDGQQEDSMNGSLDNQRSHSFPSAFLGLQGIPGLLPGPSGMGANDFAGDVQQKFGNFLHNTRIKEEVVGQKDETDDDMASTKKQQHHNDDPTSTNGNELEKFVKSQQQQEQLSQQHRTRKHNNNICRTARTTNNNYEQQRSINSSPARSWHEGRAAETEDDDAENFINDHSSSASSAISLTVKTTRHNSETSTLYQSLMLKQEQQQQQQHFAKHEHLQRRHEEQQQQQQHQEQQQHQQQQQQQQQYLDELQVSHHQQQFTANLFMARTIALSRTRDFPEIFQNTSAAAVAAAAAAAASASAAAAANGAGGGVTSGANYMLPCPLCETPLEQRVFRQHLDRHYPRDSPVCPVIECGRRFAHPNSVRNHMRIKHTLQWAKMKAMRSSGGPFAGGPDFK